jgi:FADH2 O2-dependent halogenase
MHKANHPTQYDVAILGTGIGGATLGAILARHGLKVLLLEQTSHPRFTIGESTVPETTFFFRLLAARYDVPEIANLASYQLIRRHVGTTCGVKRNFSFVYHRPGEPQRAEEATQYPTAAPPLGPDVHMFRQDVDAYMLSVAVRYGATARTRVEVTDVAFGGAGVELATREGEVFRARYLIDAGGIRSLLGQKLKLRDEPCTLRTRSRSLYTHMLGVLPYDACGADKRAHGLPSPLSQGTLHHLFDGGWMWVIPFNNHPASTNPLVSVGVNFHLDSHPRKGLTAEEEFRQFISRFPNLQKQFGQASAFREWTTSDRLQFSSRSAVGERYCLLPHATSFVDPLFSSGLGITMSAINQLGHRLIKAAADDDFSAERFAYVDHWMKRNFDYYDRLISLAYTSFSDFTLWNAWSRLWMISGLYGAMGVLEMYQQYQRARDPGALTVCEEFPNRGVQACELTEFATLFDAAEREMLAVREGRQTAGAAAETLFKLVNDSNLWPEPWGPATPSKRHPGTFTVWPLLKTGLWMRNRGPANVRKHYFVSATIPSLASTVARDLLDELRHSGRGLSTLTRDYVADWNKDWSGARSTRPSSS